MRLDSDRDQVDGIPFILAYQFAELVGLRLGLPHSALGPRGSTCPLKLEQESFRSCDCVAILAQAMPSVNRTEPQLDMTNSLIDAEGIHTRLVKTRIRDLCTSRSQSPVTKR